MRVALYYGPGSGRRARYIADAMRTGLHAHGIKVEMSSRFREVCADVAIGYGWVQHQAFEAYRAAGKSFVCFDLGYWDRRPSTMPMDGYYRMAVNDWDTATNMQRGCPPDRFERLEIRPKPANLDGRVILITSMSMKAAKTHGIDLVEWENEITARLTSMRLSFPIVKRAKPHKKGPILPPIETVLGDVRFLVTRHSNTAVDALVNGVPFYAERGVGALLSAKALTSDMIKHPCFCSDDDRIQLLSDIAYAQWRPEEMRTGEVWNHIRALL